MTIKRTVLVYFKNLENYDTEHFEKLSSQFDLSFVLEFSEKDSFDFNLTLLKNKLELQVFIELLHEEVEYQFLGLDEKSSFWANYFSNLCKI